MSKQEELFLYRVQVKEETKGTMYIVVLAPSDEKAFAFAEQELERHMIVTPKVKEWLLLEKRRVHSGSGYVIDPTETE
ncbi:DUF3906 family protein [Thermoflavimicrobium dichotomicum]|uniref:DUF3906 family protein n=1 Tax=Thermoflavimicrobium dichotomicum TaxID=46223 RepID=A0A1I3JNS4_9BACL|nr:DUF3906 family protein [Thermoflavimicrobium dichotomicum]SFI61816.1 Protein of unknown function [Thermoflavimicrobium dichotomicum]